TAPAGAVILLIKTCPSLIEQPRRCMDRRKGPDMWTNRRSRTTHGGRWHVAFAVALLASMSLAACAAAETRSPASTPETEAVAPLPEPAPDEVSELDAGTYLVNGFTVPFEITVPAGWMSGGWFVYK